MGEDLRGTVILITGGGRGLGRATAHAFARSGAAVAVASRTPGEVERVAAELRELGGESIAVRADVGRSADVDEMFDKVIDTFGHLDILVNNAGSFPVGPIRDFTEEEWDRATNVDLKAFYLCSRAALVRGGMLGRRSGHIINIGSVSVRRQMPNMAVHCALKAALLGFSESLRREVAPDHIRVSLICPGTINTELVQSETARGYVHGSDKWLEPEDVAELVLFAATRRRQVNISEVTIVGV